MLAFTIVSVFFYFSVAYYLLLTTKNNENLDVIIDKCSEQAYKNVIKPVQSVMQIHLASIAKQLEASFGYLTKITTENLDNDYISSDKTAIHPDVTAPSTIFHLSDGSNYRESLDVNEFKRKVKLHEEKVEQSRAVLAEAKIKVERDESGNNLRHLKEATLAHETAVVDLSKLCGTRIHSDYVLCSSQIDEFKTSGLAIFKNVLTEEEMNGISKNYDKFINNGSKEKFGKDFCDMSQPFDTPRDKYRVINAMLPRRYDSAGFKDSIYERVAASITSQLFPEVNMQIDYDQLLDKAPNSADAIFLWHQDMAYWPNTSLTPDTRTVTFSLALDSTNKQNGCIKYIPGSGQIISLLYFTTLYC